jgi:hypothetical protein
MRHMQIDKEKLQTALSTLNDEANSYFNGQFISLLQNSRSIAYYPHAGVPSTVNLHQLSKRLLLIHSDLLCIATVSRRLILQQLLRSDECKYRIDDELWRHYAAADIDLFFSNIVQFLIISLN